MGRPWNWGKKTTLVYERKEKTFGKKGEGAAEDEQQIHRQTETLIIRNKSGKGPVSAQDIADGIGEASRPGKTQIVKIVNPGPDGDGADPDMPPIVLASEDGAIISADALELTDAMGGTVQVQVISQEGEDGQLGTQVLEIAPTIKSDGAMPAALKTPKMKSIKRFDTPMSAPAKICTAKLKPVEEIPCQICDVYVGDYEQLLKHVKKHHMDVDGVDDYLEEVQMEMQVECPVCNIAVESQTALTVHIERQHSHIGTEIRCEPCNKTYKSAASLKNHIRQQHTARKRFECHVCSATFTETRSLREHINCVHETTETFDCDVCGKTFLTKGRLRRHKYIHGGFRHFCEYCNKGFHLRDNMNKHVEIMHEQKYGKRFQCNYCGKAFTVKGNLQQHILGVHLKKSLYECPICNEGFKRKSMMLDHMKTHARTKVEPGTEDGIDGIDGIETVDAAELAILHAKAAAAVDPMDSIEGIPVAMPGTVDDGEGETSGEEDYDYVEFD